MSKYTLEKPDKSKRNKFIVTIVADSNDADYITNIDEHDKDSFEIYYLDDLIDIKNNYSGRHELENYSGEYSIPYNGYDGHCHTLKSIDIVYVDEHGETWNVVLNQ